MKTFLQHINEAPMTTTGSTKTGSTKAGYDGPYQTRPTLDNWTFPEFHNGQPVDDNLRPIYVGPGGPNPTVGYPYIDDRFRPDGKPRDDSYRPPEDGGNDPNDDPDQVIPGRPVEPIKLRTPRKPGDGGLRRSPRDRGANDGSGSK